MKRKEFVQYILSEAGVIAKGSSLKGKSGFWSYTGKRTITGADIWFGIFSDRKKDGTKILRIKQYGDFISPVALSRIKNLTPKGIKVSYRKVEYSYPGLNYVLQFEGDLGDFSIKPDTKPVSEPESKTITFTGEEIKCLRLALSLYYGEWGPEEVLTKLMEKV